MSTNKQKIITFLDNIGRIIIGNLVEETASVVTVENPALVHIQPNAQTNQLQLQILPLFFKEFQANRENALVWHFQKSNITTSDPFDFNEQFIAQYNQTFGVPAAATSQKDQEAKTIKLFDEEENKK